MNGLTPRARIAALLLLLALAASLFVAAARMRIEGRSNRVEIAMDYTDLLAFSRSYNYKINVLLLDLRRAGLTSLALSEELGSALTSSTSSDAYAISGVALQNAARISPLANPTLAALVRSGNVKPDEVYLLVYNRPAFQRYMQQLPLHYERSGIRVLSSRAPYVIGVHTQIDYFNSTALGVPSDQIAAAKKFDFLIDPRFQNDERLRDGEIAQMFDDLHAGKWLSTAIFFGQRNQVLGFPDHVADAAAAMKAYKPSQLTFGLIEFYDANQAQKGYVELAKDLPGRTVRVQAIAKTELDKLNVPALIARYELGVRERNVRVAYLRTFSHTMGDLSPEKTNVEIVRQLANDLKGHRFRLGRATPIPEYKNDNPIAVAVAALAAPSIFVLLMMFYGWCRRGMVVGAYALTVLIIAGGYVSHHDILARSIIGLLDALLFTAAAFTALAPAVARGCEQALGTQILVSLRWTIVATVIALLGALAVVGVLSAPLLMEEVEAFRGVHLVLALPPIIALGLYIFSRRFDSGIENPRAAFASPVLIYQLLAACVVLAVAALVLERSGNQSDIAPSSFELALRGHLTTLLSVRPRFKEFIVGFPFLMMLPALRRDDRRSWGILLSLGVGVGLGDIVDTFAHLHTPIAISLLRVFNGFVIGAIVGIIAIAIYRRFRPCDS